jgi:quercetin dioxygenase-like cupin family protein
MNLKQLHTAAKDVSAIPVFQNEIGSAIAIRIAAPQQLKEHITRTPALQLNVEGHVKYDDENGVHQELLPGDFHAIESNIKHWVNAITESHLMLIK